MEILVLGCSDVFLRRVLPALHSCTKVRRINIASKTKPQNIIDNKYSEKLGMWFNDYSIAIDSLCSEIVYISLPNHLHFTWAKKSLEAGLHVVTEKPATLNLSDTSLLVNIARKKNLCFAESTVWPFHPNVKIVKSELTSFKNEALKVNATFTVPAFKSNNYRNFSEFGGGAFNDFSAYAVSVGRVLFDEKPSSISGELISFDKANQVDSGFSVQMKYSHDKIFNGFFGVGLEYKNTLEIIGDNFLFELNRVFSPPADMDVNIKSNKYSTYFNENFKGDAYASFFDSVLSTCQNQDRIKWLDLIIQDAELTNKLKSKILR
jgi:dTDP-3,4-didehydro-2,6-dideoxy-alpha-D-glucose 3-reductase